MNDKNNFDIPDFVEDKSKTDSVDMSIFKMSDEELYEDDKNDDDVDVKKVKKTSGSDKSTIITCLIVIIILLVACALGIVYIFKQSDDIERLNTSLETANSAKTELETKVSELENSLNSATNEETSSVEATYVIVDGPITFRKSVGSSSEATTYNGQSTAANGEIYDALAVVKDYEGKGWIKIADDVYLCIGTDSDPWASVQ